MNIRKFGVVNGITSQPVGLDMGLGGSGSNIKSIQRGQTSALNNGTSSITVNVTAIDLTKTILYVNSTVLSGAPNADSLMIAGVITNSTTLTLFRIGAVGTMNIWWQLVEFYAVKSLQSGSVSSAVGQSSITAVNAAKSIVVASATSSDNVASNLNIPFDYGLIGGTTVSFDQNTGTKTYYWQVIEFY